MSSEHREDKGLLTQGPADVEKGPSAAKTACMVAVKSLCKWPHPQEALDLTTSLQGVLSSCCSV